MRNAVNVMVLVAISAMGLLLSSCKPNAGPNTASSQASRAVNPFTVEGVDMPPEARAMASQFIKTWYAHCGDKFITKLRFQFDSTSNIPTENDPVIEFSSMTVHISNDDITDADKLNGVSKHIHVGWELHGPSRIAEYKKGTRVSNWSKWDEGFNPEWPSVTFDVIKGQVVPDPGTEFHLKAKNLHPISCAAARVDEP